MTISIIIPVYNVSQYLKSCIDSIIRQTFQSYEIILVDDKSTDDSGNICDSFASRDSRIIVFHQASNQGVSVARNKGIELASGDWITFIDSDDFVLSDYLEKLYSGIQQSDFVLSGDLYIENGQLIQESKLPERSWNVRSACSEDDIKYIENITSLHGKLFRRDITLQHHIQFDHSLRLGEDRDFCISYLSKISSVSYLPYAGYCYNTDIAGSLSKQKVQNMLLTDVNYWNKVHAIIGDACPKYQVNRLYNFLFDNIVSVYKTFGVREVYTQIKRIKPLVHSDFLHRFSEDINAPKWLRFTILKLF